MVPFYSIKQTGIQQPKEIHFVGTIDTDIKLGTPTGS